MQLLAALTGLLATAVSISALPAAGVVKRELGGVLICQGANATGACHYEQYSLDECHDLPTEMSANASTFAPDGDNFYCYPTAGNCSQICTSPTGCTFGAVTFSSPEKYDLGLKNWTNLIGSFTCHENTTTTAS